MSTLDLSVLSKKVGPLPVGAWAGIIGGGIVVGRMWSARAGGKLPASGLGGLAGSGTAVDGSAAAPPADADTNDAWARRAIQSLIAEGVDPVAAQRAVTNFVQGYSLTTAESLIVSRALLLAGMPPEGVPPAYIDNGDTSTGGGGNDGGGTTQPPPAQEQQPPPDWSYAAHPEYLNPTLAWQGGPTVGFLDFYNAQPANVQAYLYSLGQQPTAAPYNAQPVSNSTPEFDAFYAQQSPDVQAYLYALGQAG